MGGMSAEDIKVRPKVKVGDRDTTSVGRDPNLFTSMSPSVTPLRLLPRVLRGI